MSEFSETEMGSFGSSGQSPFTTEPMYKKKKDKPNVFKAVWDQTRLMSTAETIKNLSPEDKEKLNNAIESLDDYEKSNFIKKGVLGLPLFAEKTIASIASGNAFEEATALVAVGAGGVAGGGIGGYIGAAAGAALGGVPGAAAGAAAGRFLGGLVGGAAAGNYKAGRTEAKKLTEAGYDTEPPTSWQSLVAAVKEVPAMAVTAGLLYGATKLGKTNVKPGVFEETALSTEPSTINVPPGGFTTPEQPTINVPPGGFDTHQMMRNAWSGNINQENVKQKNIATENFRQEQSALYSDMVGDFAPGGKPPTVEVSETVDVVSGHEPWEKKYKKKARYNMHDTFGEGEPWNIIKITDRASGEQFYKFDPNLEVKSTADVAKFVFNEHLKIMSGLDPKQKEQYLLGTSLNIDNAAAGFKEHYKSILFRDVYDIVKSPDELANLFAETHADVDLRYEFIDYIRTDGRSGGGNLHPAVRAYAENTMNFYKKSANTTRRFGFELQEREGYISQHADPYKVAEHGVKVAAQDLMGWTDHAKMGITTPQEAAKAMDAIAKSFYTQDIDSALASSAKGAAINLKGRVIHFKDTKSYIEFIDKYGAYENVFEAIAMDATRTANAHGLVAQFGPEAQNTWQKLIQETFVAGATAGETGAEGALRRKAITNLYNGYTASDSSSYLAHDWLTPRVVRNYKMVESTAKNIMTMNSAQYEIIESPMNLAFMKEFYGLNEASAFAICDGFKNLCDLVGSAFNGDMPPDQLKALADIGLDYTTWETVWPFKQSVGNPYDMPMKARKINHTISKIKGTDMLNRINKHKAALQFQHDFGWAVNLDTHWGELTPQLRGILQGFGLNNREWDVILNNKAIFLIDNGSLQSIFNTEHNKTLSNTNINLLTYGNALRHESREIQAIGYKLAAAQHDFVYRVNAMANTTSTRMFLGKNATSADLGSFTIRNLFAFRGYAFDRLARSISKFDLEGHGPSAEKFAKFAGQRMQVGLLVNAFRWGVVGRKPELEGLEDWIKFMGDCSARGDLFPLSVLSEIFADHYHTQGNGFVNKLESFSTKSLGPGTSYALGKVRNAVELVKASHDGDTEKAFKKIRSLTPGGRWLPTDFMFNRVLLDNIFTAVDEDAAYNLFKSEIKSNNKQHFRYFTAPGSLTKVDALGKSGIEEEENQLKREIKEGKKTGAKVPMEEARTATKQLLNKLQQLDKPTNSSAKKEIIGAQTEFIKARMHLEKATYYAKNKPAEMSEMQAAKALTRAIKEFKPALKKLEDTIESTKQVLSDLTRKRKNIDKKIENLDGEAPESDAKISKLSKEFTAAIRAKKKGGEDAPTNRQIKKIDKKLEAAKKEKERVKSEIKAFKGRKKKIEAEISDLYQLISFHKSI